MFCSSHGAFDSKRMREQQVFVNVAFDFEYVAEDGKKVFMKENEVLLLINKTNRDWWQVRRGVQLGSTKKTFNYGIKIFYFHSNGVVTPSQLDC